MRFLGTWGKFEDPAYDAFTDDMLDGLMRDKRRRLDNRQGGSRCIQWCESYGVELVENLDEPDTNDYSGFPYDFYVVDEQLFTLWLVTANIKTPHEVTAK